ncbi:MAG: D-aminoacyl-tRNA deacylase [Pseudomonadota bacterium]
MIALIQRVTQASVTVNGATVGQIDAGLLALIGVEKGDSQDEATRLLRRLCGYRIFADDDGKMNRSVADIGGELLLVPQFTLAASTHKGMRPSFSSAARPEDGERLFAHLVEEARHTGLKVDTGQFGADMKVDLSNDGPVTFWLQVAP